MQYPYKNRRENKILRSISICSYNHASLTYIVILITLHPKSAHTLQLHNHSLQQFSSIRMKTKWKSNINMGKKGILTLSCFVLLKKMLVLFLRINIHSTRSLFSPITMPIAVKSSLVLTLTITTSDKQEPWFSINSPWTYSSNWWFIGSRLIIKIYMAL